MRSRPAACASVLPLLLALACGGDSNSPPASGNTLSKSGGDGQSAVVTSVLQPYQVTVLDEGGQPAAGISIQWSVTAGGGTVAPATSITDAAGVAEATATLGTGAGPQTVQARIGGSQSGVAFVSAGTAGAASALVLNGGDQGAAPLGTAVPVGPSVRVTDQYGNPRSGTTVSWMVLRGGGSASAPTSTSSATGIAQVGWTLGDTAGGQQLRATAPGLAPVDFSATATSSITIAGGGNNVADRFGSDLWLADGYGYSGTWYGPRVAGGSSGNAVKVWHLSPSGAPTLVDSIVTPTILDVSDLEVSPDGHWLVVTAEGGTDAGALVYELTAPGTAVFRAKYHALSGFHTGSLSVIGGVLYLFAAENPGGNGPALTILDLSQAASGTISLVSRTGVPANYGIHDTFVRDGICFAFVWNSGVYIYDVGKGVAGGTLAAPVKVGGLATTGGEAHNGWWFWNPTNGEKRYLFIGQEGPGSIGASSVGDIHVVDVSNLASPVEVASFRLAGAGAHNFWMDEAGQRLYAAFYNGGVVALDVSGTLSGDLSSRKIAQIKPGGAGNTYVWGVMLYNGSLYANDMLSGFWQLGVP